MTYERKPIPGYPYYEADTEGNIYSVDRMVEFSFYHAKTDTIMTATRLHRGRLMKPRVCQGYMQLGLSVEGTKVYRKVHRLIAITFLDTVKGKDDVNHKDGDKTNNHLNNLEWCTQHENTLHATRVLKKNIGQLQGRSKLKDVDVMDIKQKYSTGRYTQQQLAAEYGVHQSIISSIHRGINWTHIK